MIEMVVWQPINCISNSNTVIKNCTTRQIIHSTYQHHLIQIGGFWNIPFAENDDRACGVMLPATGTTGHLDVLSGQQVPNVVAVILVDGVEHHGPSWHVHTHGEGLGGKENLKREVIHSRAVGSHKPPTEDTLFTEQHLSNHLYTVSWIRMHRTFISGRKQSGVNCLRIMLFTMLCKLEFVVRSMVHIVHMLNIAVFGQGNS